MPLDAHQLFHLEAAKLDALAEGNTRRAVRLENIIRSGRWPDSNLRPSEISDYTSDAGDPRRERLEDRLANR